MTYKEMLLFLNSTFVENSNFKLKKFWQKVNHAGKLSKRIHTFLKFRDYQSNFK